MPDEATLKAQIKDDWDAFIERSKDMSDTERITRLIDYARATFIRLAGEIDKLSG